MTQEKPKNRVTEWSFSFEDLGKNIDEFVRSLGRSGEEAIRREQFAEAIGTATSARVRLDLSIGEAAVRTAADPAQLIEADLTHIGDIDFVVAGDTVRTVHLSQRTTAGDWARGMFGWIGAQGKLIWNIGLTPNIPLELDIHSGVGKTDLNLRDLNVTALEVHGGTGEFDLMLPASAAPYSAIINGGVGEFDINVPANATVDLALRAGTGEMELAFGEGAAGKVTIKGGVGAFEVRLPYGAAARLEAEVGLGDVSVPGGWVKVSGDSESLVGKSGVWESPNFANAERTIVIQFSGGVGGLRVK